MKNRYLCGAIGVLLMTTGVANAEIVASFGFTDLTGDYRSDLNRFKAVGRSISSGDFTRIDDGTAFFNDGSLTGQGTPSFYLEMTVENIDSVNKTADGTGEIRITDADGDNFVGTFSGAWLGTDFGFTFASNTGIDFHFDGSGGDGVFNGSSGGSFTNFADNEFFTGAVSLLFLQPTATNFFQSDFRVTNTQADGVIIPAPAGMGVLAGLGLVAARRRRA